jgi:hypothetical protein
MNAAALQTSKYGISISLANYNQKTLGKGVLEI